MTFFRYLIIQVCAYVIDMGGFLFLLHFGLLGAVTGNVLSKLGAGVFAFVAHRNFTFDVVTVDSAGRQAARYFFVLAVNVPIASAILSVLLFWIPSPAISKFLSDILCVAISFFLSKHFIFRKPVNSSHNAGGGTLK